MNVIVSESAHDDLDQIYVWIAKDNDTAADAVVNRILASVGHLGRFPHLGHPGKISETYEWIVPSVPYVVVYKLHLAYKVLIVIAIFHCAQHR